MTSRPARALWIEIGEEMDIKKGYKSRPARALWIEIIGRSYRVSHWTVEAREGLVD